MGEGKSEGGPGVDRGGGRGCQLGPGLSSGSLFLPRVSLGAAGDNVALRGAAGGGGTRRTQRYPPGPTPAGTRGLGAAGRARTERFPQGRGGGFLLSSPVPLSPEGAPKDGRCPAWWLSQCQPWQVACAHHRGLCRPCQPGSPGGEPPCPQTPQALSVAVGGHPWPCSVPPSHRQPHPSSRGGVFVPGGFLLPFIPGGLGTLAVPAGTPHLSGCRGQGASVPPSPSAPFRAPLHQDREYSLSQSLHLSPARRGGGCRRGARAPQGVRAQRLGAAPPRCPDAGDVL